MLKDPTRGSNNHVYCIVQRILLWSYPRDQNGISKASSPYTRGYQQPPELDKLTMTQKHSHPPPPCQRDQNGISKQDINHLPPPEKPQSHNHNYRRFVDRTLSLYFSTGFVMSTEQERLPSVSSDASDDCKASRVEAKMSDLPAQELDGDEQEVTKESEKKEVSVNCKEANGEKDSGGIQTKLLVDKEGSDGSGTKAESLIDMDSFMALEPYESKNESPLDNNGNAPVRSKVKFLSDSDLVWAKVRSHPWWPGQVFDASASSDKAKKHFKKGSFLVTYFGDCSYAWNDATKIKPFRQHFSQLAKQSSLPDFVDAVGFALEEVSRRIEFGLACSCVGKEVFERVKTQKVINPGVREESSRVQGGDKVSSAVFFEPGSLVEYVKGLACYPRYDASDELMFVSQRARLLAFSRWKGFIELPEFETLRGSVESAPKMKESAPEPKKSTKRRKTEDKDHCERDGVFEYEDTIVLKKKKKEKTLAEFIAEIRLSKSNGKRSHGEKKRMVVDTKPTKSAKKMKTNLQKEDSGSPVSPKNDQKITPKKAKTCFGIGASILRVANQMHCSTTPTGLVPCSKNNGSGEPSPSKSLSSRHSASTTKASSGKPNPISKDKLQSGELEHVVKETASTNIVEDSVVLESRDLKDDEQMVNEEDRKEAENIVGETTVVDSSNLTEQLVNKN
ncbi:hypothetical protein YC2023_038397 [Brassica napus]